MRKHLTIILASAAAVAALTTAAPVQATGTAGGGRSMVGTLTLGQNQSLGGTNWSFTESNGNLSSTGSEDRASSLQVTGTSAWVVYQHDANGGRAYCVLPGQSIPDLHHRWWQFGDTISSVQRLIGPNCFNFPMFLSNTL
ncbi:beta/gamma crystallin-related protein [Nonomuraea sp. NPDC050404]|uniref:beta/gamma crystallin-related protein n=1 Tax=Nonomuraea sp. NPDC050404 TaxID=3155783 RepID=UPI0033F375D6